MLFHWTREENFACSSCRMDPSCPNYGAKVQAQGLCCSGLTGLWQDLHGMARRVAETGAFEHAKGQFAAGEAHARNDKFAGYHINVTVSSP